MAEVVLGLASSHTPQLSTSAGYWSEHAARDRGNTRLLGPDGRYCTYDELLATADPALADELRPAVWRSKAGTGCGMAFAIWERDGPPGAARGERCPTTPPIEDGTVSSDP